MDATVGLKPAASMARRGSTGMSGGRLLDSESLAGVPHVAIGALRYVNIDLLLEHLVREFMRVREQVETMLMAMFTAGDDNADGVLTYVSRCSALRQILRWVCVRSRLWS